MKKELNELVKDFPHTGEAAKATLDRLKESRKTCVIMPTGTGKTIVSSVIVNNLGGKTMYLCPNSYILEQTKENYLRSGLNSQFMTYPEMMSRVKSGDLNYFSGIDLFILDEFHRLGSEIWGESWKKIERKFPKSKILGLTATEHRYLDNGRDMAKELFGRNVAYELSLSECFKRGILRAPKYIIGADITSSLKEMEDKAKAIKDPELKKEAREMIKILKHNWTKAKGISECYRKHIIENPEVDFKKMIVFHERINKTEETKDLVIKNLRDAGYERPIKFYVANSEEPDALGEVKRFNTEIFDGLKVLLTVNMCNEGLHVDGCTVEVMYRSTLSKNIYLQQIGRVLSLRCKTQPIILDLVQNVSLSDALVDKAEKDPRKRSGKHRNWDEVELPEGFEIINMTLDYQRVCEMLDEEKYKNKCKIDEWYDLAINGDFSFII